MKVTYSKLKKYTEEQGGYDLLEREGRVTLSFIPSFPEAEEKRTSDSPPRIVMEGNLKDDILTFSDFFVEEGDTTRTKDPDTAELTYSNWIAFIEENY